MGDLSEFLGSEPAPVEQPEAEQPQQEAQQVEATGDEVAAAPAEAKEDPIETHRKGLETAVVAERRKRQEAEQRAAAIEAQLQQFMQQQQPREAKPDEGAPNPDNFQDNPQEYWRQLARYEARQELKADKERFEAERQQQAESAKQQKFMEAASNAVKAGQQEFDDFDAVVNQGLAPFLSPVLQQALVMTSNGHKVAYYLGKNPLEAARISQLDPMTMLIELGELRTKAIANPKPSIPRTLTTARDARGQFAQQAFDGPTPLDAILSR
jgi:hypothetical protein